MHAYLGHSNKLLHTLCLHYITMSVQVTNFLLILMAKFGLLLESDWVNPHASKTEPSNYPAFMLCLRQSFYFH